MTINRVGQVLVCLLGMLVFSASLWCVLRNDLCPDEIWFIHDAGLISKQFSNYPLTTMIFSVGNRMGYGSLFWLGLTALVDRPTWLLRLLVCAPLMTCLAVLCAKACQSTAGIGTRLGFFLLCMTPIPYWSGKLISPDTLIAGLGGWCILSLDKNRRAWWPPFLGGVCAGLKLNAAPFLAASAAWMFLTMAPSTRASVRTSKAAGFTVAAIAGFLLANPFIFTCGLQSFMDGLAKSGGAFSFTPLKWIFSHTYCWDGVFSGGLVYWLYGPVGSFLFMCTSWFFRHRTEALWSLLAAFATSLLMLTASPVVHGWYWIPMATIASLIYTPSPATPPKKPAFPRPTRTVALAGLSLFALSSLHNISREFEIVSRRHAINSKREHLQNLTAGFLADRSSAENIALLDLTLAQPALCVTPTNTPPWKARPQGGITHLSGYEAYKAMLQLPSFMDAHGIRAVCGVLPDYLVTQNPLLASQIDSILHAGRAGGNVALRHDPPSATTLFWVQKQ